jgi:hypothetical protein
MIIINMHILPSPAQARILIMQLKTPVCGFGITDNGIDLTANANDLYFQNPAFSRVFFCLSHEILEEIEEESCSLSHPRPLHIGGGE